MENIQIKHPEIAKMYEDILRQREKVIGAPMRQHYHFMPDVGWINDPNGLVWFRGRYHAFFQYGPEGAERTAAKWGHAVSDDLFHWQQLPPALIPDQPYDKWGNGMEGGCYSGSALVVDDRLYVMYTGATENRQVQCLAWSDDGVNFEKYEGNPVAEAPEGFSQADFRDPKMFRHGDSFYMVLGATRDNRGFALLFKSPDLFKWEFVNILAESRGEFGFMWECPDFFPVGEDKFALIFSPCGLNECQTVYMVGEMDFERGVFDRHVTGVIDWGQDFYAPQTFLDDKGRRLMIAWASAWEWMPYWQGSRITEHEGWCNGFNLPREIRLMPDDTLAFIPVEEVKALRESEDRMENIALKAGEQLDIGRGIAFELEMEIDLEKTNAREACLELRRGNGKAMKIIIDLARAELRTDRSNADEKSFGVSRSRIRLKDRKVLNLHLFADNSSVEIFADDYRTVHSVNFYPAADQDGIALTADGEVYVNKIYKFNLRRTIW